MGRMTARPSIFNVSLLDDLHTFFPDVLYRPERFHTVQDLLGYIQSQARTQFNPFDRGLMQYNYNNSNNHVPDMNQVPIVGPSGPIYNPVQSPILGPSGPIHTPIQSPILGPSGPIHTPVHNPRRIARSIMYNNMSVPALFMNEPATPYGGSGITNLVAALFGGANEALMEPVYVSPSAADISANTVVFQFEAAPSENCAICQDAMNPEEPVRRIRQCAHTFHRECVDEWFRSSVHCPNCRIDIRTSANE